MKRISPGNSKNLKTHNRILIRNIIRRFGPIARYEVAREVGLTPPTVTMVVNELIHAGVVLEVGFGESSGGRRPVLLELNPRAGYVFAVRLQRDEAVTALFNLNGDVLSHYKQVLDTSEAEEVVAAIGNSYDWLIENTGIDKKKILCCGLAAPGLVNSHRGVIEHSSNLRWDKVPLGAMLSKRLYGIPVHVENISNAAALAEKECGCGRGYQNLIYINFSVGIGAGIIMDGEIYSGSKGYAGEIGHTTLVPVGGPKCACGRYGCLEAICGVSAIMEQINKELSEKIWAEHGPNKRKLTIHDLLLPSFLEIKEVKDILEETGKWIGIIVANLVSIFNPSLIVLGGELPKTGDCFTSAVISEMNQRMLKEFVGTVKVISSTMEEDPPLLGAYVLALEMLFSIEKWDMN